MRRKLRKVKEASLETIRDRNIHAVLYSLLFGALVGAASYKIGNVWISSFIAIFGSSLLKNILIKTLKVEEKGWAFSHVYWPSLITWFAVWTFLLNL